MDITKEKIIQKLNEKNAVHPCARCGSHSFTVLDGFSKIMLDEKIDGSIRIGGPMVPVAIIACTNCGALTMHALGALGLLEKQGDIDGTK